MDSTVQVRVPWPGWGEGTHPCLEPPPHPSGGPPTWSTCTQAAGGSGEGLWLGGQPWPTCGLSDPRPSWHHCSLQEGDPPRLPAALNGLFNWGLWMWPCGGQQSCTSTRCLGAAQKHSSSEPFPSLSGVGYPALAACLRLGRAPGGRSTWNTTVGGTQSPSTPVPWTAGFLGLGPGDACGYGGLSMGTAGMGSEQAARRHLKGSDSCTSRAAPRIRPSFSAWANAFSSTRPPRAVFTRKAPCLIWKTRMAPRVNSRGLATYRPGGEPGRDIGLGHSWPGPPLLGALPAPRGRPQAQACVAPTPPGGPLAGAGHPQAPFPPA